MGLEGPSHFVLQPPSTWVVTKFMEQLETGERLHRLEKSCLCLFSLSHCVPHRVVEVSNFAFKIGFSLFHYTAYV